MCKYMNGNIFNDMTLYLFGICLIGYGYVILMLDYSFLYLWFDNDIANIKYVRASWLGEKFSGWHCWYTIKIT